MSQKFLPYGRQSIDQADIDAVVEVLQGDWLTTGPAVSGFEEDFAAHCGASHAVACSNATAGLHLALAGLDLGPGDVCVVPSITFLATANAALYCGADVVFADVDPATGLMTPDTLLEALARAGQAKAVLPVHLAGQCEDLESLSRICCEHGASMIEDACHAVGTRWRDKAVGGCAHSAASVFSFHPVKTLAAGEGGMVTTNDDRLAERMRTQRSHGMEREPEKLQQPDEGPWWYEMQSIGWNYRLTDMQAALVRSQLSRLPLFKSRRQALAARYDALLGQDELIRPNVRTAECDPCFHLYSVRIDFAALGTSREAVMKALHARGIGTQVHYIPIPSQPYYRERYGDQTLPGAAEYYAQTLTLPLFPGMEGADPDRVVDALREALGA